MSKSPKALGVICVDCGREFFVAPEHAWKNVCRFCYREEESNLAALRKVADKLFEWIDTAESLEKENTQLREELARARSECLHWRQIAGEREL